MNWYEVCRAVAATVLIAVATVFYPQPYTPPRQEAAQRLPGVVEPSPAQLSGTAWQTDPEVSWYGPGFYGHRTACGKAYTRTILGVAHRTLPCGTLVEFRYKGRSKVVPVIDRGPYVEGRTWDLSGGLCTYLRHCFTGPIEWRFAGSARPELTPPPTDTGE